MIAVAAIFVVALSTILGAYWIFVVRPEEQAAGVVRKRLKKSGVAARELTSQLLREEQNLSAVGPLDRILRRLTGVAGPLELMIEQSGVRLTVGTLLLAAGCAALVAFLLAMYVTRMSVVGFIAAAGAGAVPFAFVNWKRAQRMLKFEEQFPEALDLLARSLRSGHALTSGIQMVAEEMPDPVGPEFQLLYDRQNFGMPFPDALRDLGARIPVIDAKFFVTALLTQRESGGNLSEILDNLSSVIRERFRVKRQVRVLSAHGRITGWVLAGLPPALAAAMMMMNPGHLGALVEEPLGRQMIVGAIGLQVLGTLIIRKLVRIEY
jgi:tight adherence protein B